MKKNYILAAGLAFAAWLPMQAQKEMPDALYLCGTPNKWTVPADASENELITLESTGDGIYEASFYYSEKETEQPLEFKIFSTKGTWENINDTWGTWEGPVDYVPGSVVKFGGMIQGDGWGNFTVNGWNVGDSKIKIDWLAKTIELTGTEVVAPPESLHLVGEFNGWEVTNHDYELGLFVGEVEGTHYTGTFTLPVGEFKIVAGDSWDVNFGAYSPYDLWKDTPFEMALAPNGNNFLCRNWQEGEISINVNWEKKTVTFTAPDQPEYSEPESLHLAGTFNDWEAANHDYMLEKMDFGTTVYVGSFNIPEGVLEFKILADDEWKESYGCNSQGFQIWSDVSAVETLDANGGNFVCTNWKGGRLDVQVDWGQKMVILFGYDQPKFEKEDALYLVGAPQGWDITSDFMKLKKVDGDAKVYEGAFEIKEGEAMFRFYTELGDWETNSIGSQVEDSPIDIAVTDDAPYSGAAVWGKGSWNIPDWVGGMLFITVDLDNMTVDFNSKESGVHSVADGRGSLTYSCGVVKADAATVFTVTDASGRVIMQVKGDSADLNTLPRGMYIVKAGRKALKVMR